MSDAPETTLALLHGNYTPAAWRKIKADPELAPQAIAAVAAAAGCRLAAFYFALGDEDFYGFVEGASEREAAAVRHCLQASGDFTRLHSEPLLTWDAVLPLLQSIKKTVDRA